MRFLDTEEHPLIDENSQSSILIEQYIQVQNNLAQVYLLNSQYESCLKAIDEVLKYDSKNIKALYRQARAYFELGNYDQAITPLNVLLKIQNQDIEKNKVNEMLYICETKLAKYKKNEKEIYRRMFTSTTAAINEKTAIENINEVVKLFEQKT